MKRVLSVIHGPRWGGIHTLAERIGPACRDAGFDWIMVLPQAEGDTGADRLRDAGLDVISIPLRRIRKSLNPLVQAGFFLSVPLDIYRLIRLIRQENIDIVQTNGLLHFHSAIAGWMTGIPVVWVLHSDQPPRALKSLFTPWVRRIASAIMTSGCSLVRTHPGLDRESGKTFGFLAPVDMAAFRPDPTARHAVRAEWGVTDSDIVVGTVGGRGPNKNHSLLIEVMREIGPERADVKLRICGAPQPHYADWYEREVISPARQDGLLETGRVDFIDPGSQVARCMNGFDIFCLPSRGEGASIVVAEAMATGLPVVANAVGAVPDSVLDGQTGHLNHSLGAGEMARHILDLADNADRRKAFGEQGRRFAGTHLSVDACVRAHTAAYEHALSAKTARARAEVQS